MSLASRPMGQRRALVPPETRKPQKNRATTHEKATRKISSLLGPPTESPKPHTKRSATTIRRQSPPTSEPPEKACNPIAGRTNLQSVVLRKPAQPSPPSPPSSTPPWRDASLG
ncbi:hypothetical protein PVAP13_1KG507813 [Panicum virgatum]|uniref:Uncharacterized protein n=1 Tax=Panicum virgatum TaxID=38727 RepID=A0A8T0XR72_PANVG|nr:hypothetical protein PVAP13_1KG507813 [Panicum virgatum]